MVFCGKAKLLNLVPQEQISIDVHTENLKTTNLKIHQLVLLPLSMKIGIYKLKYVKKGQNLLKDDDSVDRRIHE